MTATLNTITAADHTKAMQAVMQFPLHIVRNLATPKGRLPSDEEVIEAALQVRAFDPEVHEIFQRIYDLLPSIAAAKANATPETLATVEQFELDIQNKTLDEVITVVQDTRAKAPELAENLTFVEQMYKHGADTIYSPTYPPAEFLYPRTATFDATSFLLGVGLADGLGGAIAGSGGAAVASISGAVTAIIIESV